MTYYRLNLDCNKSNANGELDAYWLDPNPQTPISYPNNPKGRVWWKSIDQQNWSLVTGSDAAKPGDPKHSKPVVANLDTVSVAIRDDQNNPITSVQFAMVFGRRGNPNQAPIASPFQNTTGGANLTYDQTILSVTSVGPPDSNGFIVGQLPTVTYPGGGSRNVNFGCYLGASVDYDDTSDTVRQFGLDPEMDVVDYAASPEPAAAGATG